MNDAIHFLIQHGYILLFVWVLAEQMGLPLPAIPLLLAAGALAGSGRMDLTPAISPSTGHRSHNTARTDGNAQRWSRGVMVDLRQPLDVAALPQTIPGAVRMGIEDLESCHQEIPRDRDVVLYCS